MFTVEKYLSRPYNSEELTVTVGEEEFLIRRPTGSETLDQSDIQSTSERYIEILAKQLLDGDTKKPIGRDYAKKFLDENPKIAIKVVAAILSETNSLYNAEMRLFEDEIKNSKATDTESSTGSIASDSVSIPSQQDPAENI